MTRDQLIAQAEALEWAAKTPWPEYVDPWTAILAKAEKLRAQAEAMPSPPDQSARVAELESLLEQLWPYAPWPSHDPRRIALNAALAKGE